LNKDSIKLIALHSSVGTPIRPSALESSLIWYARHFPVRRGKMRIIDGLWRMAAGAAGHRRTAKLVHGNYRMPCDVSEPLQRQFYFFGTYFLEQHLLECWVRMARGAEVIFDVGANAGIYSLAALSSNPLATVHAFEPTPEIAARLHRAVDLNGLDQLEVLGTGSAARATSLPDTQTPNPPLTGRAAAPCRTRIAGLDDRTMGVSARC
jgi:hypothetical protein